MYNFFGRLGYRIRDESITRMPFGNCRLDDIKQAELMKKFVDRKYPHLEKKSLHYVMDKMCFVVAQASRCHAFERKEEMIEAREYGTRYFLSVIGSRVFTIKYKMWFCFNFFMLWCRIGRPGIVVNCKSDRRKGES